MFIDFGITGVLVVLILWGLRKDISLSPSDRRRIRLIYLFPLIIYFILTTVFAEQIIGLLGPSQVPVLGIRLFNTMVLMAFPTTNVFFILIYFINLFIILGQWEWIVKLQDRILYGITFLAFLSINLLLLILSGDIWSVEVIEPFGVWLGFMIITYAAGTFIAVADLKKQFKKALAQKKATVPAAECSDKKRLLLISPINDRNLGYASHMYLRFPPLALGILSALTPRDKFHVELIDEQFERFSYREADLVAITAFTVYAKRAYDIAAIYRKKGIPVIMGGIHVSMVTEEALAHVDCVVAGEAENIWPTVLEDFLNGRLKHLYQGSYPDLKNMIIPDRSIFDYRYVIDSLQTSRGCPHNCNFCSVTRFNGGRYRQRPVEEILDELATIPSRYVFIADDNLVGNGRAAEERALALFKGMVKRKLSKRWMSQTTIEIGTKPELLKWAARSGCLILFIGLECIDAENLENFNKKFALKVDYKKALKAINRAGIGVLGAFLYGSDWDTREKMMERADFVARDRVDIMHQMILTPIPGSQMFTVMKRENRILCDHFPEDWESYNGYSLTHIPRGLSQSEFLNTYRACMEKTYAIPMLWAKFLRTWIHTRRIEVAVASVRCNYAFRAFTLLNLEKQKNRIAKENQAKPAKP